MIALGSPTAEPAFKVRVGDDVCRRRTTGTKFDVVNQTFARAQQAYLHQIDAAVVIVGAVVHGGGDFDVRPRRLARFITVSPVGSQTMVAARINEFEAAAAAMRPLSPSSANAVSDFIDNDPGNVGLRDSGCVGVDHHVGHGYGKSLAAAGQMTAKIANGVVRIQIGITHEQVGRVLCHDEVPARRDHRVGGDQVVNAGGESPATDIDGIGALVVELNILFVVVAGDRAVHDFVLLRTLR